MVATQKKAAENLAALATKRASLRDAAKLIVGAKKEAAERQIQGAVKEPGALRRQLGIKQAKKLPAGTLAKAAGKIAAEFIKASRDLATNRKAALAKAAAHYQTARRSSNREHIKKATAHLTEVLALVETEKRAALGKLGPWLMKLLQKLGERTAGLGAKGVGGVAKRLSTQQLGGFTPGKLGAREMVQVPMKGAGWLAALKDRLAQLAGGESPRLATGLGAGTAYAGGRLGLSGLSALGAGPEQD